jgi:hypothetical protein
MTAHAAVIDNKPAYGTDLCCAAGSRPGTYVDFRVIPAGSVILTNITAHLKRRLRVQISAILEVTQQRAYC